MVGVVANQLTDVKASEMIDEVVEEGKDLDQITCRFRVQIRTYQLKIYT